jgi:ChrR-like protein with cupin domain
MVSTDIVRQAVVIAGLLMIGAQVGPAPGGGSGVRVMTPADITWTPVAGYPPGYARAMLEGEASKPIPFTYRVRLPAHFTFQPHTHASDEHVTVLEGTWFFGVGERFDASRLTAVPAGSFVVIPAGTPHFVYTERETIVQAHGMGPIAMQLVGKPPGQR